MKNPRNIGFALVFISALVFSTVGLFAKGITASAWDIIFWRGGFAVLFTFFYMLVRRKVRDEISNTKFPAWLVAFVGGCSTIAFISSYKFTSIANVSMIYAATPLIAALLAWIFLRERPGKIVLTASLLTLFGVMFVVNSSIGTANILGDFLAALMTLGMASVFVIYRKHPDIPSGTSVILSSLMVMIAALVFSSPFDVPIEQMVGMIAFGLIFAIASITMVEGAMRISPMETALISTIESPLGPVWAFLVFTEVPPVSTVIGGAIILGAVIGWQYHELRMQKSKG